MRSSYDDNTASHQHKADALRRHFGRRGVVVNKVAQRAVGAALPEAQRRERRAVVERGQHVVRVTAPRARRMQR